MPFKSKAQQKMMFATHPRIAREMATKTKNMKSLPAKAAKKSSAKKKGR